MFETKYPGLDSKFDIQLLIRVVDSMSRQIPGLEVNWLKSNEPLSVFNKPSNSVQTPKEEANHVTIKLNGHLIFESYKMKIGSGRIFIFSENLNEQQEEILRNVLVQNQLKVPGKGKLMVFLKAGFHAFLMFIVLIAGILIGNIYGLVLAFFAGLILLVDILIFFLILIAQHGIALPIVKIMASITYPTGMLLDSLADYVARKAKK